MPKYELSVDEALEVIEHRWYQEAAEFASATDVNEYQLHRKRCDQLLDAFLDMNGIMLERLLV